MTYIFRPSHYNVTDAAQAQVYEPGGAAVWWLGPWSGFPLAAAIDATECVAAYRAVNTPGSVWGSGPGNIAESYINLNNPGTYDAAAGGGGAPAWDPLTGWDIASTKYLTTGIIPGPLPGWSVLVRFSDAIVATTSLLGVRDATGTTGYFYLRTRNTNAMWALNGGSIENGALNAPVIASGNYGMAKFTPYRNGVAEINTIGNSANSIPDFAIFVGSANNEGVPLQTFPGKIQAVAIYNIELDVNQMAALGTTGTGAMAAL